MAISDHTAEQLNDQAVISGCAGCRDVGRGGEEGGEESVEKRVIRTPRPVSACKHPLTATRQLTRYHCLADYLR